MTEDILKKIQKKEQEAEQQIQEHEQRLQKQLQEREYKWQAEKQQLQKEFYTKKDNISQLVDTSSIDEEVSRRHQQRLSRIEKAAQYNFPAIKDAIFQKLIKKDTASISS